jgi:kumamolisin
MKFSLIIIISLFSLPFLYEAKKFTQLRGSFGQKQQLKNFEKRGFLNSKLSLTLTLVTGSWANTQLVSNYYKDFLKIVERTDMHTKVEGSVPRLSQVFNTTFIEYKCPDNQSNVNVNLKCFSTLSEVTIPEELTSAILGIMGLEQVLTLRTSNREMGRRKRQTTLTYNFLPTQVAQIYGFPNNSKGEGIKVGIISLGGYFNQSDLNSYFTQFNLSTAPQVNVVVVDGAKMTYVDSASTLENYLDIEILASIVPNANITLYLAPNSFQSFYNVITRALQQSDVVSCSWDTIESVSSSYWSIFQAMFAKYSKIPFFIATGDQGAVKGVGFPASCPNAISKFKN